MSKHPKLRRGIVVALALLVMSLVPSGASAGTKEGGHCLSPSGLDLNEFYGVTETIVAPFCTQVGTGESWRVWQAWSMGSTFKKVPKGFVPAGSTPLEDFVAKFIGVKYVVDPGTPQVKTYSFTNVGDVLVLTGARSVLVNPVTLGTLEPLSVGGHVVDSYWSMSALHCDGVGRVLEDNCLPAGDTFYLHVAFEVTALHN